MIRYFGVDVKGHSQTFIFLFLLSVMYICVTFFCYLVNVYCIIFYIICVCLWPLCQQSCASSIYEYWSLTINSDSSCGFLLYSLHYHGDFEWYINIIYFIYRHYMLSHIFFTVNIWQPQLPVIFFHCNLNIIFLQCIFSCNMQWYKNKPKSITQHFIVFIQILYTKHT